MMQVLEFFQKLGVDYNYVGILFVIFLNSIRDKIFYSQSSGLVAVWGIIETLPHELSHWIVAFFTGGKPVGFSIIPSKTIYHDEKDREIIYWAFGEVIISNPRSYNVFFIGLSPLFLIYLSYLVYKNFFNYVDLNLFTVLAFYLVLYSLIRSGIPSSQDVKVAFSKLSWVVAPLIAIISYFAFTEFNHLFFEYKGISFSTWFTENIKGIF